MTNKSGKARAGSATFHSVETQFRWEDIPTEQREELKRAIKESILDSVPVEQLVVQAVQEGVNNQVGTEELVLEIEAVNVDGAPLQFNVEDLQSEFLEQARITQQEDHIVTQEQSSVDAVLEKALLEHPKPFSYAISFCIFMLAVYYASPLVALAGASIAIWTALHHGSE